MTRVGEAIKAHAPEIDAATAYMARVRGDPVGRLRAVAVLRMDKYARNGRLEKWEKFEKSAVYIRRVLIHDLMDWAEREDSRKRAGSEEPRAPLTAEDRRRIAELRSRGLGSRAIANIVGRNRDTVRYWTRKISRGEVIA